MYTHTMLRALQASRISRSTDDSTSLSRQDLATDQVCAERAMKIIGRAVDDGVSASKIAPFDRPDLGPWLTDPVKINSYDVIVWWRLDRAVRSMADLHLLAAWAKKHGKKLVFAEGPGGVPLDLDMSSPISALLLTVLAFAAEMEAQAIRERVQSSHNYLATQPRWAGGAAPYGYHIIPRIVEGVANGKTLEIVPEEAKIIWEIVDLIINGESLQGVAVQLNNAGTPAPRADFDYKNGKPVWRVTPLARMLKSVTLMGHKSYKGQPVLTAEGDPMVLAPGIIEPAEFRLLQKALAKRSDTKDRTRNVSPLLGIIFCGVCGGPAYRQPERVDKDGYRRPGHYLCYGRRVEGINPCKGARMNEEPLTKRINRMFLENIGPLDRPETKFIPGSDHMAELEAVEAALDNLQAESDRGLIRDQEKYINRLEALTTRQKRLAALEAQPDRWEERPSGKTWGEWWEESPEPLRRDLLLSAGFKVWLLPGGDSMAYWPGKSGMSLEEFLATLKD